jgi:hypothetical protein
MKTYLFIAAVGSFYLLEMLEKRMKKCYTIKKGKRS